MSRLAYLPITAITFINRRFVLWVSFGVINGDLLFCRTILLILESLPNNVLKFY